MKSDTRTGEIVRCGTSDPGIAASANANNKISAVRIEVSWVHRYRNPPRHPKRGRSDGAAGRLDSAAELRVLVVVIR